MALPRPARLLADMRGAMKGVVTVSRREMKENLAVAERLEEEASPNALGANGICLVIVSALIPIVGIVLGLVFVLKQDRRDRSLGVTCLVAAAIVLTICAVLFWFV